MNPILEAALAYAQLGWRIFPVVQNSKLPAIKEWPNAATTDQVQIVDWFADGTYNIGIVCGRLSNLLVIDLDRHHSDQNGFESIRSISEKIGPPPTGLVQVTAGAGVHLLYVYPSLTTKLPKKLAPGIDLQGEGRYIVATPSAIDENTYRWNEPRAPGEIDLTDCTEWLEAAMALMPPKSTSKGLSTRVDLSIAPPETPETIAKLRAALKVIPPCVSYDDWRNVLFSVHAHGFAEGELIAREWSANCIEKYDDAAFDKVWNSDRGYGIDTGTVYWMASKYKSQSNLATIGNVSEAQGDINNGREFARHFKGKLLYCHAAKKWLYWQGHCWIWCDRGQHVQCAKWVADRMLDDAANAFREAPSDSRTKELMRAAKSLHGVENRLLAMLNMATTEDGMGVASPAMLDSDPWLLGVRNGVVDLRSGKLLPAEPSMLITKQCDATFDAQATCPRFEQFLQEVFQGDEVMIAYVQRQLGYAQTGKVTEEVLFFWFGCGANGKSVLVNIVSGVAGSYAGHVSPDLLRAGREAKSTAERATLRLAGLRMVLMNELAEGETWDDGRLREITSREKIAARYLYGEMFDFLPTHKLFVRGNNKPAIRDGTDGTWRRLQLVGFDRQFSEAERIIDLDKQILDTERDGILNWLIKGCLQWQKESLKPPAKVRNAVNEYRKDCDVIGEWMESCCAVGPEYRAEKRTTYNSYKCWSVENGMRPLSGKGFSRRLRERVFDLDAGKRNYIGFKVVVVPPPSLG